MADDLEAFLRQAAEQRLARKRAAQQREAKSQPAGEGGRPAAPPPPPRPAPGSPEPPVVDAVLVEESVGDESVAEHVNRHLDSSAIEHETRQLGGHIEAEERKFEEHVHQAFDHDLSQLDERPTVQEPASEGDARRSKRASFIVELFQNRERLREAIILGEVLRRPPGLD